MTKSKAPEKMTEVETGRGSSTRTAILTAAERTFAQSGLAGARIDVIAAEAGVNKALLYYYFKSKEALYEAVLEEHLSAFNRRAMAVLTGPGSARSVLLDFIGLQFDFISARRRHVSLVHQFISSRRKFSEELVQKYIAPRVEALNALLERGMRAGEFRRVDRMHVGISIGALITSYFSAEPMLRMLGYADPYGDENLQRRKQEVLDFVRHGLFTEPDSSAP